MTQTNRQNVALANDFVSNLVAEPTITAVFGPSRSQSPFACLIRFDAPIQGTDQSIHGQCRFSISHSSESRIHYFADVAELTNESVLIEHTPGISPENAFTDSTYQNQLSRLLLRLSEQIADKFSDMWLHTPESIDELHVLVSAERLAY